MYLPQSHYSCRQTTRPLKTQAETQPKNTALDQNLTHREWLVGWSRGAMIALWVANDLSDIGIGVDFVGLYDPVDMAPSIPYFENEVKPLVAHVVVVGPVWGGVNYDYVHFIR